jgi:NADH:ubiquinone oxidoreductase subunit F (NADH-binding)
MKTPSVESARVHSEERFSLLALLHATQEQEGAISPEAVRRIAGHARLTDNEVFSFASFFPWLRFASAPGSDPKPTPLLAGLPPDWEDIAAALVKSATSVTEVAPWFHPEMGPVQVATRNCGSVNPEEIGDYLHREGYSGLEKALAGTPEEVEAVVIRSGLEEPQCCGLSWDQQWNRCRQSNEKGSCLIGHATGADPLSLVECTLIEKDPHGILEGMLIAGYAAGVGLGILYVDRRRPLALSRLQRALDQMQASGYLGDGIRGSGFNFHIQLIPAAGPLPYGEVQWVIAALEGRRPHGTLILSDRGKLLLHGHPAVIHSVETLAKLPAILHKGADWYAGLGINGHKGTGMITLAGCIRRPGLAEIPLGIPLRKIIADIGGGVPEDKACKAVQVGGPTGEWLAAEDLDIPFGFHTLAASGTRLGSGSLVVAADDTCAVDLARRALLFATLQSCGHCNFCREGTRQMSQILHEIIQGRSKPGDLELLEDLAAGLQLGSACGLGQSAAGPFLSTFNRFRNEYELHVKENRCLSGFCQQADEDSAIPDAERQGSK